jgi:uncharacterized phage protein (TIGR02218 family)
MRPAPAALAPFLAANRFFPIVPLFTFVLTTGEVLRYSGSVVPLTLSASLFAAESLNSGGGTFVLGPRFGNPTVATKIGVQADTVNVEIMATGTDLLHAVTWQQAFHAGIFDGALIEVSRMIFQPNIGGGLGPAVGAIVWFQGYVGNVEIGRSLITITANSMLGLLNVQYPRRLWQHTCSHVFGDAMCQFDRTTYAVAVIAQGGTTQSAIVTGFNPSPVNLYTNGTIIGQSGQNNGYKRTVADAERGDGTAYLSTPFIYPVAVGDAFEMLPGCGHNLSDCQFFNNLSHFGGQPWVPPAEFAI